MLRDRGVRRVGVVMILPNERTSNQRCKFTAPTPLNMDEREELKLLRKENADLRMDNEFWGKEKQRPCCAREASVDERYALMHVQKAHVSMARMARQMISLPFLDTISGSMPTIATMRVVRHVSRLVAVWML
jgi:hypothetical protein